MDNRNSRDELRKSKRIIVKVGTAALHYENGRLNLKRIDQLAFALADLRNRGKEVALVSSGAIAVGAERLGLKERPRDTVGMQAASAVGQAALMQIYENIFMRYNQKVAQILLTKDVIEDDVRRRNAKNTFSALFSMGVIPVVNENDTVSTDELGFSDNDTLSAYVAAVVDADLLVILSDIDGLRTDDPKLVPDAEIIHYVNGVTDDLYRIAGSPANPLGTGGMVTKLNAAAIAEKAGIRTVIAGGAEPNVLFDILDGTVVGTLFDVNSNNNKVNY